MNKKKVLYIYGYGSNTEGNTATWLKNNLPNSKVYSFYYDQENPSKAIDKLCQIVHDFNIDIVIGSSLGGWYAMHVASVCSLPLIAINPLTDSTLVAVINYVSNGNMELCNRFSSYKEKYPLFETKEHWHGYRWDCEENGNYSVLIWSDSDEVIKHLDKTIPNDLDTNFLTKYVVKNGKHQLTDEEKKKYIIEAYNKLVNEIIPKVDNFYKKTLIIP